MEPYTWVEIGDGDFDWRTLMSLIVKSQWSALCVKCFDLLDRLPLERREPTDESREPKE